MDVERPRPDERGTLVLVGGAVLVAILAAAAWWWAGRPQPIAPDPPVAETSPAAGFTTVPPSLPASESSTPADPAATPVSSERPDLTVDVRGAVRTPGVLRLPDGSRVMDAIEAAGGLRAGARYGAVNLARPLTDGEQIVVGRRAPAMTVPPAASSAGGDPGATGPVDLNTATAEQLETLDGIGPVLAADIVQWRTDNGRFSSVDDLLDVSGIGDATLAGLRDQVTVG